MNLTLLFGFSEPGITKEPVQIPAQAAALVPNVGDIIEDDDGVEHRIVARAFEWDRDPVSIIFECERRRF